MRLPLDEGGLLNAYAKYVDSTVTDVMRGEPLIQPRELPPRNPETGLRPRGRGGLNGTAEMHADRQRRLEIAERVIAARRAGYSYRAITKMLREQGMNISTPIAHKYMQKYLQSLVERTRESVAAYRQLELERCDRLQAGVWEKAIGGDVEAVFACIKVMDHRAKLLGLAGPNAVGIGDEGRVTFKAEFGGVIDVTPEREAARNEDDG